jgi:hypothetical protein
MEVVINTCFGGFGLSKEALARMNEIGELDWREENRSSPLLVQVVEEMGARANGSHARLKVVEIPDGTDCIIEEYDGKERIVETHRAWF